MESSPPTRPWQAPSSPVESRYSINLDALDLDGGSDTSPIVPKPKYDRIFSEDIDGPSDFTQNMEHWIRGGSISKKTIGSFRKHVSPGEKEMALDERDEDQSEKSVDDEDPEGDNDDVQSEGRTMSHHTPTTTPPRVSVLQRSQTDDRMDSEWDPYGMASTPFPQVQKNLLQPTVEDYHSELTPAPRSQRRLRSEQIFESLSGGNSQIQSNSKTPRTSTPMHRPRSASPVRQANSRGQDSVQARQEREEELLEPWRAKCQQLERFIDTIQRALDEERRLRHDEGLARKAQLAAAEQRERSTAESNRFAQQEIEMLHRECESLRETIAKQEDRGSLSASVSATSSQEVQHDVRQMQADSQAKEIQALRAELETARSNQQELEQSVQASRLELENAREAHETEVSRLRLEVENAHGDELAIAELEKQLRTITAENEILEASNDEIQEQYRDLQQQLSSDKIAHSEEISRHTSERTRAVEVAAGFQQQLQEFRQQLRDEQAKHEAELESIRTSQNTSSDATRQELELMRTDYEAKISELNEVVLDRDEAQDALQRCQEELDAAKTELSHVEAVNAALDARISDTLRQREKHWRDKLEEADRERQIMAKALLHQWGREETGIQDPQQYAYKYLQKTGASKSPARESR